MAANPTIGEFFKVKSLTDADIDAAGEEMTVADDEAGDDLKAIRRDPGRLRREPVERMTFGEQVAELARLEAIAKSLGLSDAIFDRILRTLRAPRRN